jgi:xylan 1,4-beta-xylosidase
MRVLVAFLCAVTVCVAHVSRAVAFPVTVRVQAAKPVGPLTPIWRFFGADEPNYATRRDGQKLLAELGSLRPGQVYFRAHNLLTSGDGTPDFKWGSTNIYTEKDGNPVYDFTLIDQIVDTYLARGLHPYLEIGFMPEAMTSAPAGVPYRQVWRAGADNTGASGWSYPPRDYSRWSELLYQWTRHNIERYGRDEVERWYFEVWNEPNLDGFFAGTQQDYFELYAVTARAIKSVSPAYRVGGPATAGCAWVSQFIDYCVAHHVPVDFVSSHDYAVDVGHLDETGGAGTVFSHDPRSIYGNVLRMREQIAASPLPNLELHLTEWSSSYTPADPLHDSYHSAAFILDKLKKAGAAASSMSYWVFTDIFEEAGPRFTPFHGGFGLLNYQDIRKPAFFAYQFLNRLGPTELESADPASYVTTDGVGNLQVLLWDFTVNNPKSENNQVFYRRDLTGEAKGTVKVHLAGIPPGRYTQTLYQVGYRVNDAYAAYRDLGAPTQLTRAQVEQINAASAGQPIERVAVTIRADGAFDRVLPLRENDVFLLVLEKSVK